MGSISQDCFQRAHFNVSITNDKQDVDINNLPELILFNAINNSHKAFCAQSRSQPGSRKKFDFIEITYRDLGLSIENCCARILDTIRAVHEAVVGKDGAVKKSEPIALLLESDLTLFIYLAALLTLNIPVSHHY